MKKTLFYKLNLQLFADGAEAVNTENTGDEIADAEQKNADFQNEFNDLINGKFKEQFAKKTQEIIDKRFKQTKELEAYKEKLGPTVSRLMEKYGLSDGEEGMLYEAVMNESSEENGAFAQDDAASPREQLVQNASSWVKEGEKLKEIFPDFDLRKELRGSRLFAQLLLSGTDLRTAYEVVHKDEILSGAMAYTAGKVREQIVQGIQAKGMRPLENGITASGAVVTSIDVNSLTSKDILKILKQVENGESVSF